MVPSDSTDQFERRMADYERRHARKPSVIDNLPLPNWLIQLAGGTVLFLLGGGAGIQGTVSQQEVVTAQADQGITSLAQQLDYWHDRAEACEAGQ